MLYSTLPNFYDKQRVWEKEAELELEGLKGSVKSTKYKLQSMALTSESQKDKLKSQYKEAVITPNGDILLKQKRDTMKHASEDQIVALKTIDKHVQQTEELNNMQKWLASLVDGIEKIYDGLLEMQHDLSTTTKEVLGMRALCQN